MLYLVVIVTEGIKCVLPERIITITEDDQFSKLYEIFTCEQFNNQSVEVYVRQNKVDKWVEVSDGLNGDLKIMEVLGYNHVKFSLIESLRNIEPPSFSDAFDIMMRNARQLKLPQLYTEHTRRDLLYNEIIELLQNKKAGWRGGIHQTLGKEFVERVANALWYIDPHLKLLQSRSCHMPALFKELATYASDNTDRNTYNIAYHTSHHKKESISHQKLDLLIKSLELSIGQPWVNDSEWDNHIIPDIIALVDMMRKYSEHLVKSNTLMAAIHHNDDSARNPANNSHMFHVFGCKEDDLNDQYRELNDAILQHGFYQYMDVYSYLPIDIMKRYRFLKNLQLTCSIGIYRYAQGNYLGTITYIWKIPESEIIDEFQDETQKVRMLAKIHEGLPKYFTRQIRKNVLGKYSLIKNVTPAVLRMLYFDLTGNAAVTSNTISREIEERLRLMLALEDPSIIFDLLNNNGFKGNKFDIFWNELDMYFNEETPAVDDRRHNTTMHMPLAISIRDLRDIILAKLHIKNGEPLPAEIYIPSCEWIRLQFWPTNSTTTKAIQYTGRYQVKFKVQGRLLRKKSVDSHYCAALFCYLREFLIQYRQWACFISADDKHKVPIGESVPVSTGVRNRQSLSTQNNDLNASDHDFTKLSFTPSVIFFVSIPSNISGGFYNGQVFVSFKDTVFEPSSAIRHATEFQDAIHKMYTPQALPPILCLYTDGLQNVAIMRNTMSDESEALFDKADTLDEIRDKANKNSNLKMELRDCIKDVQSLLHSCSERLVLKDQYFKCYNAASEYDINGLFQIKKCQDVSCNICTPIRLPQTVFDSLHFLPDPVPALDNPDHYTSFQAVYGKQTSEEFRPSLQLNQANAKPAPKSVFASGKIRDYIMCCDCGKWRCVYSDKALSQDEIQDFKQSLDTYDYSCGAPLFPDDHYLAELLFVRVKISCDTPMEILYYSSRKSGNSDICYHCGTDSDFIDPPDSIRTKYKIIYPLCQKCQDKGKEFNAHMEVKVNGSNSKRRKTR
ncbi:unnamed protein product [Rhizophagus irregularis]|nr:unnamed protein product [Rhizophagus irregularis]